MEELKIAFDAKRAVCNNTGLGNYSRLVVDVLSRCYSNNQYMLYSPVNRHNDRLAPILERQNVSLQLPEGFFASKFSSLWRVSGISSQLKRDGVNLFHGLSNELPLNIAGSSIPSIVTIHDLIFRHLPQCYKAIDRKIYDYKFSQAAKNATRVIAISECTRRDIINFYGISPDKIDVIYQGCHPIFSQPVSETQCEEVKQLYLLPQKFIIAVGTVETRKNQMLAIKALRGLPQDINLIIVGRRTAYSRQLDEYISHHNLTRRVRFLEGVPLAHLPALYRLSQFASYTSRYEGFGLPVIEALRAGTPVIAATGSCLEEAGGEGAFYVEPDNEAQYIACATQLLADPALCHTMVQRGRLHATRFSDATFAHTLTQTYLKTLSK